MSTILAGTAERKMLSTRGTVLLCNNAQTMKVMQQSVTGRHRCCPRAQELLPGELFPSSSSMWKHGIQGMQNLLPSICVAGSTSVMAGSPDCARQESSMQSLTVRVI